MTRLFYGPVGPWHRWFAWRPVNTITHGWVWLRTIERQRVQTKLNLPGPIDQRWDYRPLTTREEQTHD